MSYKFWMRILYGFSVSTLLFSLNTFARVDLLENTRVLTELPNYTTEEKQLIASQAEFFLSNLYVHKDLKIRDFGQEVDPTPHLQSVYNNAASLSSEEFHSEMIRIFSQLRDGHTVYEAPRPLLCVNAYYPIHFLEVLDQGRPIIAVFEKGSNPRLDNLLSKVEIGDELLAVDGVEVRDYLKELEKQSEGPNEEARRARSINMLSLRIGAFQHIPKSNSIQLKLRGRGGEYEIEMPWLAHVKELCMGGSFFSVIPFFSGNSLPGENQYQNNFNETFFPDSHTKWEWFGEPGLSEVFETKMLESQGTKIGYIHLKSFRWRQPNLDIPAIIDAFRHEMQTRFADADSLVIDVRGNAGGLIPLAEKMVQLFTKNPVEPTGLKMLATDLNHEIFLQSNFGKNRWSEAIESALKTDSRYTSPVSITPRGEANNYGQIWFKPVVVVTDATCYSACEFFVAGMQDSNAALIIGNHKTTGGGGANVMSYGQFSFMMGLNYNPFEVLPYGHNMQVAWRQAVRTGTHRGELFENVGVQSDVVIALTKEDIFSGGEQLKESVVKEIAKMAPRHKSGLKVRRGNTLYLKNGETARWKEEVFGVDEIQVLSGDALVAKKVVKFQYTPQEVELVVPGISEEWTDKQLFLVGKKQGETVFRVMRELSWRGDYIPVSELKVLNFDDPTSILPLRSAQFSGPPGKGWQVHGNCLGIGSERRYEGNVLARAILPLQLSGAGATMVFDLDLFAEEYLDNLRIYAQNPETLERKYLFVGWKASIKDGKIHLPTDWGWADLVFEFQSDENWHLSGPVLDNIRFIQ